MFTVKVYDNDGSRAAYECKSYHLVPAGVPYRVDTPADHPRLFLMDGDGDIREVLTPAPTTVVYVMNDGGQTIDTMRFGSGRVEAGTPPIAA